VRTRICAAVVLAVVLSTCLGIAQEDTAKPWETWRPPAVEMPDPNAWEIYLLAFELEEQIYERLREEAGLPPRQEEADRPPEPMAVAPQQPPLLRFGWGHEEPTVEELQRLADAYDPVFAALEAAMAGEAQPPPIRSLADTEEAFPHFVHFREAARMFSGRALLHRREERSLEAALDCIACVRLGADVGQQRSLIAGLVQVACQAIGEARLREDISTLDGREARIALNALQRAMADAAGFGEIMAGEAIVGKTLFIETIAPALGDEARLAQVYGDEKLAREARGVTAQETWPLMVEVFERRTEQARKPYWAREAIEAPENPIVGRSVSALERAGGKFAYMQARLRLAVAGLAAQAFRADAGVYPATLDALVPDYLQEVPRVPFADAPMRSIARDPVSRAHPAAGREPTGAGVLTIYSVGPDGDDDGGADIGQDLDADGDIALVLGAD